MAALQSEKSKFTTHSSGRLYLNDIQWQNTHGKLHNIQFYSILPSLQKETSP